MRAWVVVGVVLLAACSSDAVGGGGADSGATLACAAFRDTASDFRDGVLTVSELRDRIAGFEDEAEVSAEPGVAAAARDMLAAATAGDDGALGAAVTRMDAACTSAGV